MKLGEVELVTTVAGVVRTGAGGHSHNLTHILLQQKQSKLTKPMSKLSKGHTTFSPNYAF